jgi:hypothetical protein
MTYEIEILHQEKSQAKPSQAYMGFLINDQTREIKKVVALPDLEADKDGDLSFESFPISL